MRPIIFWQHYLLLLFRWGLQLEQAVVPFVNRLGVQFHVQNFAGTHIDKDLNSLYMLCCYMSPACRSEITVFQFKNDFFPLIDLLQPNLQKKETRFGVLLVINRPLKLLRCLINILHRKYLRLVLAHY